MSERKQKKYTLNLKQSKIIKPSVKISLKKPTFLSDIKMKNKNFFFHQTKISWEKLNEEKKQNEF